MVHVLTYGRSGRELPLPTGTVRIDLPSYSGKNLRTVLATARFLFALRRRCYDRVIVSQPALHRSRARGLLIAFPFLIGSRRATILDPDTREILGEVGPGRALLDLCMFLALHSLAYGLAACATTVLNRWTPRRLAPSGRASSPTGSVLYLRTDIDLAGRELLAGGSVAHTEGILRAILRRGSPLAYWSTGKLKGLPSEVLHRPLPVIQPANAPIEISELISGLWQTIRAWREPQPIGFVYQRYSLNNLAGLLLARHWGVPLVLEVNSSEANWRREWSSLVFPKLAYACERLLLESADVVCTVSENAARELEKNGADRERLVIAPNAVEVERFARARPRAVPFEEDAVIIAFVGLFYPWHGVRHLAEAFVRLHVRHGQVRLLLLGDGEQRALVRKILEEGGVLGATHMSGMVPRDEVAGYLAAAHILVSPHADVKRFPGSPIKIFEYMASGRAIVASNLGQIGAILRDDDTALLVAPGDEQALEQALERLVLDPALREHLGSAAQAEARERHSWDERLANILAPLG